MLNLKQIEFLCELKLTRFHKTLPQKIRNKLSFFFFPSSLTFSRSANVRPIKKACSKNERKKIRRKWAILVTYALLSKLLVLGVPPPEGKGTNIPTLLLLLKLVLCVRDTATAARAKLSYVHSGKVEAIGLGKKGKRTWSLWAKLRSLSSKLMIECSHFKI